MNEEVEGYIRYALEHWPECIEGLTDPEEIGRHLARTATSGPRLWCGENILRELGVFVEYEPEAVLTCPFPAGSRPCECRQVRTASSRPF